MRSAVRPTPADRSAGDGQEPAMVLASDSWPAGPGRGMGASRQPVEGAL